MQSYHLYRNWVSWIWILNFSGTYVVKMYAFIILRRETVKFWTLQSLLFSVVQETAKENESYQRELPLEKSWCNKNLFWNTELKAGECLKRKLRLFCILSNCLKIEKKNCEIYFIQHIGKWNGQFSKTFQLINQLLRMFFQLRQSFNPEKSYK